MVLGDRRYRIRGLAKNLAFDVLMKVNVLVGRGEAFHVDTLDLYSVRSRNAFVSEAARELNVTEDVIRHDVGKVLRKLEELQERQIEKTLQPIEKPAMPAEDPKMRLRRKEGASKSALGASKEPRSCGVGGR